MDADLSENVMEIPADKRHDYIGYWVEYKGTLYILMNIHTGRNLEEADVNSFAELLDPAKNQMRSVWRMIDVTIQHDLVPAMTSDHRPYRLSQLLGYACIRVES